MHKKYANFSTILKWRLHGLKSLLLTKQHDQTTKPRPLVQKSRLERFLKLLTTIMGLPVFKYANFTTIVKCRFHGLKNLLRTKQHDQTTIPISLVQKSMARKIFGTSDENRGLTCFKICKFFDYKKMSFLRAKKPPFEKTT